VTFMYEETKM